MIVISAFSSHLLLDNLVRFTYDNLEKKVDGMNFLLVKTSYIQFQGYPKLSFIKGGSIRVSLRADISASLSLREQNQTMNFMLYKAKVKFYPQILSPSTRTSIHCDQQQSEWSLGWVGNEEKGWKSMLMFLQKYEKQTAALSAGWRTKHQSIHKDRACSPTKTRKSRNKYLWH